MVKCLNIGKPIYRSISSFEFVSAFRNGSQKQTFWGSSFRLINTFELPLVHGDYAIGGWIRELHLLWREIFLSPVRFSFRGGRKSLDLTWTWARGTWDLTWLYLHDSARLDFITMLIIIIKPAAEWSESAQFMTLHEHRNTACQIGKREQENLPRCLDKHFESVCICKARMSPLHKGKLF